MRMARSGDKPALKEALAKRPTGPVDKKSSALAVKAADGGTVTADSLRPSDDQLAKINQFTRSTKGADDVVVVPTLACNDLVDRDLDRFTTNTVQEFAKLPAPFSPIGKSFMVGHDYTKLPVGRIFDAETVTEDGATHLKLYNYIPNTDANKSFIENLDFGVNWAVSVGVTLQASMCNICASPMYSVFGWSFCEQGHEKGFHYDPESDERDDWGYLEPVDASAKGAVLCHRDLEGAADFYELSQVFLGAQYFAEVSGKMASVVKNAGPGMVQLGAQERQHLPSLVTPSLEEALRRHAVEHTEDGTIEWVDEEGLVWLQSTGNEKMCLGKRQEEEEDGSVGSNEREEGEGERGSSGSSEAGGEEDPSVSSTEQRERSEEGDQGERVGELDEQEEEEEMSKAQVITAATKAGLPTDLLEQVAEAEGNGLDLVLQFAVEQRKQVSALQEKATLGDKYIKELRADAIAWYTKANQKKPDEGVDVAKFERLLEICGDNVDLIKELRDQQQEVAKARFPDAVRRSTFDSDPNESPTLGNNGNGEVKLDPAKIKHLHG